MSVLAFVGDALAVAGSTTWQIAWSLIFGFTLSAVVQAVVRREAITRNARRRPPHHPREGDRAGDRVLVVLLRRGGAGPVVVPQGRQLHLRDGLRASTNLVIELGIIMALLLGWQF